MSDKVPSKELVKFTGLFVGLLIEGKEVVGALRKAAGYLPPGSVKDDVVDVADDVESGTSLSGAMARHPSLFSESYRSMIAAGVLSGELSRTAARLFGHLELEERFPDDPLDELNEWADLARSTWVLAVLMRKAEPMPVAIDLARGACRTKAYRDLWAAVSLSVVQNGGGLSEPMKKVNFIESWVIQQIEEAKGADGLYNALLQISISAYEVLREMVRILEEADRKLASLRKGEPVTGTRDELEELLASLEEEDDEPETVISRKEPEPTVPASSGGRIGLLIMLVLGFLMGLCAGTFIGMPVMTK